jgi:adenylate cyclase
VRGEARDAAERGVLAPVRFGGVELPIDVRAIHTIDLDGWRGDPTSAPFRSLVAALTSLLGAAKAMASAGPTTAARPERAKPSVCVLPFDNISGDPEQEYFSDGISEDIITDLSKIAALEVTSRNSAFSFKGRRMNIADVARQLGVSHVLEGSVRKAGSRVRITAQLIEGATDMHLWAERYDRDLDDIFAVQDEISRAIVAALKVRLAPEESEALAQRGTTNPEAYKFYLMARRYWVGGWSRRRDLMIRLCEKAISLDPNYAQAWAMLSICQADLRLTPDASGDFGWEAAQRAVELDPDLAEGHSAKGRILNGQGRFDEAAEEHRRALELDPASYEVNVGAARWAVNTRRYEKAISYLRAASVADPNDCWAPGILIMACEALGDEPGALAAAAETLARVERVLAKEPDNGTALSFGVGALVRLGEMERAKEWAEHGLLLDAENSNGRYNIACALARGGEVEIPMAIMEEILGATGREGLMWMLQDTDLDRLRGDPRFQAMIQAALARLGVEGEGVAATSPS